MSIGNRNEITGSVKKKRKKGRVENHVDDDKVDEEQLGEEKNVDKEEKERSPPKKKQNLMYDDLTNPVGDEANLFDAYRKLFYIESDVLGLIPTPRAETFVETFQSFSQASETAIGDIWFYRFKDSVLEDWEVLRAKLSKSITVFRQRFDKRLCEIISSIV